MVATFRRVQSVPGAVQGKPSISLIVQSDQGVQSIPYKGSKQRGVIGTALNGLNALISADLFQKTRECPEQPPVHAMIRAGGL